MSTRVLFVCTGNICRSPMAERMMIARLPEGADVIVRSAGTHALVDHPMDAMAALVAREYGADPDAHAGREASVGVVTRADLVLTATTVHRDEVLTRVPQALRRVFTMREFVRLGKALPAVPAGPFAEAGLADRIAQVAAQRGQLPAPEPGADDIGDPFGGPLAGMQACGSLISSIVDSTLHILGIPPQT